MLVDYLLSQKNPPYVVSSSYGEDEQSGEIIHSVNELYPEASHQRVPESYARRVCRGFAQLGARGVTFVVSSGDGGVGDGVWDPNAENWCQTNDGKNTTVFQPMFPAG